MPPTVLLLDDEPNVLHGLQRVLWKEPYEILSASSTAEAFNLLQTRPVDVVIADQDMPDMIGTEFLGKVQQEFPATVRVILTGKSSLDAVQQALDVGIISKYLTKPCHRADLSEAIRQAVDQRSTRTETQPSPQALTHPILALKRFAQEHPDLTAEWVEAIHHTMHSLRPATQPVPGLVTQPIADLERLAHDSPETLTELLEALYHVLLRKGLLTEAQSLRSPYSHQGTAPEGAADDPAELVQTEADDNEAACIVPDDASFASYLRQLCLDVHMDHKHSGIIRLQRTREGLSISTLGDISLEDCRLHCANAQEVFLVQLHNGKIIRARLNSMHSTFFMIDTERAVFFKRPGEKLLIVFPSPPHEYYVWVVFVDSIYFKMLKLGYKGL